MSVERPAGAASTMVFRWRAGDSLPPFRVVVLDEGYDELLRRDGIDEAHWRPDAAAMAELRSGRTYHWLVLADERGKPVASPLGSFRIE